MSVKELKASKVDNDVGRNRDMKIREEHKHETEKRPRWNCVYSALLALQSSHFRRADSR